MITKEEFLKAVDTINAYLEQSKEIKEISNRHKIKDFYEWLFMENINEITIHMKNKFLRFISCAFEYYNIERRIVYTDEFTPFYLEQNLRTSKKNKQIFIDLIKQYETIHPKTIH